MVVILALCWPEGCSPVLDHWVSAVMADSKVCFLPVLAGARSKWNVRDVRNPQNLGIWTCRMSAPVKAHTRTMITISSSLFEVLPAGEPGQTEYISSNSAWSIRPKMW